MSNISPIPYYYKGIKWNGGNLKKIMIEEGI